MLFMQNDSYDEVLTIVSAGVIIFAALAGVIIFFIFYFHRKKLQYQKEKIELQREFEQNMLQSRLEVQERTFTHISQEIHDNIGQALSVAKLQLNVLEDKEGEDFNEILKSIKENISTVMTDLRDIAKSLNSNRLQAVSLNESIIREIVRLDKTGLSSSVKVVGIQRPIEGDRKLILFRIVQEVLQNIIKHAEATWMLTILNYKADTLEISIRDNGKGFDVAATKLYKGLGLQSIINRTALIGGHAKIASTPEKGAHITIIVPYGE
jgi:signal transduction histidine kinase